MERFEKMLELDERVKLIEKQMGFLVARYNNLSDTVQKTVWDIEKLQGENEK